MQPEVLAKRPPQPAVSKVFPFKPREQAVTASPRRGQRAREVAGLRAANVVPLRPAPAAGLAPASLADDQRRQ